MKKTEKNYIPFIAGMATMILLACLISASLAKEDPPANQPQVQAQAGDLRLACGEAGIALFGVERVAPGETLKAENGAEIPAVLTYTDEKGEVHYYVEAETIADILDVNLGAAYHKEINCVDFGAEPALDEKGEPLLDFSEKPRWYTGNVKCDIDYTLTYDDSGKPIAFAREMPFTMSSGITVVTTTTSRSKPLAGETEAEWAQRRERVRQATPLKPEYGVSGGMYTEVDPAEVDMASWSGTAMKGQKFRSEKDENIEQSFAFTPYLGEYAVITIENTGTEEAVIGLSRPYTVGNLGYNTFTGVRVPAGGKLVRAFRIDENLPLENLLNLRASSFTGQAIELTLTAEQYRFGK